MATTTSATTLFTPLPSTAFTYKNPNLSSSTSLICNFTPISISISHNPPTRILNNSRSRSSFGCSAVGLSVSAAEKTSSDVSDKSLAIAELGISEEIVHALSRRGITELFPIQRAVLDPAMAGRDMIGRAITGSGKTLAFGIPILDNIIRNRGPGRQKRVPSALVLAPTRELARQVQKEFKESAPRLSSACLYGGMPIMNQVRALGFGIDIAVGTPGRIIDLVERGSLDLSEVKFAVLDEADQMLAVGFQDDVEQILSYLPKQKQCMLFSATMPSWVNELSRKYLRNPVVIDLVGRSDQKLADGISLYSVVSSSYQKENILPTLISTYGQGGKSIVFTRTKRDAEDLSVAMRGRISSKALHGNMQQFQRDRTLAAFRDGRFDVLVATDVAARGLDIPNVDLVIHYEIPNTSEIFVHRSGRTGRAGKKGTAVLMYTNAQRRAVSDIERDLRCKFQQLPSIEVEGNSGNRMRSMDMGERSYGRNGSSRMNGLEFSEKFAQRGSGSSGGYETRDRQSRGLGSYGGYETRDRQSRGSGSYGGYETRDRQSRGSGSYGGYETRDRQSRGSRQTERFGYDTSRRSNFKSPPSRDARESRSNGYNEFRRNLKDDNSDDEKRLDGFRDILDMLKEKP